MPVVRRYILHDNVDVRHATYRAAIVCPRHCSRCLACAVVPQSLIRQI